MKVSLFVTCVVDNLYPDVAESLIRILSQHGVEVDFPTEQTCCGQPAFNAGYWDEARALARQWVNTFQDSEYIVVPSGSCAGMIVHNYLELLKDDAIYAQRAEKLIPRVYEFTQFMVNVLGVTDVGCKSSETVVFHPSCHCTRFLGVRDEPRQMLNSVRGLTVVPIENEEMCCGFGGTFSIKMSKLSAAMADEKIQGIQEVGATTVVSTDMGCLMQLDGRSRKSGNNGIRFQHICSFLDEGM